MEKRLKNLLDNTMRYINDKQNEYIEMPGMHGFSSYLKSCAFDIWQRLQTNTLHEDWLLRLNNNMKASEQRHRFQNGLPKLDMADYQDPLLVQLMGFNNHLYETNKANYSSKHDITSVLDNMKRTGERMSNRSSLSFEQYLSENKIQPTASVYKLFLFLEYIECFRKRNNQTIKTFCEAYSPEEIGVYAYATNNIMCFNPKTILQNLGEDIDYSDMVISNSIKLFRFMNKQLLTNLPDDYIKFGKSGMLDDLLISDFSST